MSILEQHAGKWAPEPNTGCYVWTGALQSSGRNARPVIGNRKTRTNVARRVCEEVNGPPPTPKHETAHNTPNGCIGGLCVNGDHLRWATTKENQQDIPSQERSDRIRRGATKIPIEVKKERSRKANAARWGH